MRFMSYVALATVAAAAGSAGAQTAFDGQTAGQVPSGWTCGVTGTGAGKWQIETDAQAPSPPNVLTQRGRADFPWCVLEGELAENGTVAVSFKPISGKEDQAGGVVWRWKDANTYYVARGNAVENNVSLYHVSRGVRHTIKYQSAPGSWPPDASSRSTVEYWASSFFRRARSSQPVAVRTVPLPGVPGPAAGPRSGEQPCRQGTRWQRARA